MPGAGPGEDVTIHGIFFRGEAVLEILFDDDILVRQAGGALQQAGMQIEDVARIGFTSRRAAQEQRNLAIGPGVLGKVVIDDQGVAPGLHELLADGAAGVGSDVLQRSGLVGGGDDHDGVLHGAVAFEQGHGARHGGFLLPDGDVDADQVLALLVDDRVDGDGGLAGLAVADDQFALAAADGDHRVRWP